MFVFCFTQANYIAVDSLSNSVYPETTYHNPHYYQFFSLFCYFVYYFFPLQGTIGPSSKYRLCLKHNNYTAYTLAICLHDYSYQLLHSFVPLLSVILLMENGKLALSNLPGNTICAFPVQMNYSSPSIVI